MAEEKVTQDQVSEELLAQQEEQYQAELTKHQKSAKKAKAQTKAKRAATGKATPAPKTKKDRKIVGVKDLEKEFKIPGKTIRRHLRKMNENTKPRGPEPYQWFEDDKNYQAIRENLKVIVKRKVSLQR